MRPYVASTLKIHAEEKISEHIEYEKFFPCVYSFDTCVYPTKGFHLLCQRRHMRN